MSESGGILQGGAISAWGLILSSSPRQAHREELYHSHQQEAGRDIAEEEEGGEEEAAEERAT